MNDNELFKLCKEVYDKTGWVTGGHWVIIGDNKAWFIDYTSDYLLENLPRHIMHKGYAYHLILINGNKEDDNWVTDYYSLAKHEWYFTKIVNAEAQLTEDETPLKALLKLTLALHEAGEL